MKGASADTRMADDMISLAQKLGCEQDVVWTVNTREGLYSFLDSQADGVITDQVELALEIRDMLEDRSDYDIIIDRMGENWKG